MNINAQITSLKYDESSKSGWWTYSHENPPDVKRRQIAPLPGPELSRGCGAKAGERDGISLKKLSTVSRGSSTETARRSQVVKMAHNI